jgi:predicted dehydrogenase
MSQIRIAVIGADQLDPDHHTALNTLSEAGQIAAFALDVSCDEAGFEQFRSAMRTESLDAVIVAGDQQNLRPWIETALSGAWPVYTTYPVALTVEDMIEIRRSEQNAHGARLQFGFTARHHDSVATALAKVSTGEFGSLLTMRAVCGLAGREDNIHPIFGLGAQMIDIMQAFAGPFQDIEGFADLDRDETIGSETNLIATLRTHTGTLASLHISTTQWRPTFRLELGYERGYLWLEGLSVEDQRFGQEALISARIDGSTPRHETVDRFEASNGALASLSGFLAGVSDPAAPRLGDSQQAFDTISTAHRILAADPLLVPLQERHVS